MGLSHNAIKMLESIGADSDPVQEAEGPHQQNCADGAVPFPSTEGGDDLITQWGKASCSFEATGELDVFHQRDFCKPSDPFEDIPSDEEGLVACGNAAPAGTQIHHVFDESGYRARGVEADVEASADASLVGQRGGDGLTGVGGEVRIGVKEQEHLAPAVGCTGVELACASRGSLQETDSRRGWCKA